MTPLNRTKQIILFCALTYFSRAEVSPFGFGCFSPNKVWANSMSLAYISIWIAYRLLDLLNVYALHWTSLCEWLEAVLNGLALVHEQTKQTGTWHLWMYWMNKVFHLLTNSDWMKGGIWSFSSVCESLSSTIREEGVVHFPHRLCKNNVYYMQLNRVHFWIKISW